MKDKGKIIHSFKVGSLCGEFLEVEYHTEVKNSPGEDTDAFCSSTIITKKIGSSIEDSNYYLHKLSNYDCNYTIEDLEVYLDNKIKDAEYEVERWNTIKKSVLSKANELGFGNQKFNHLKKGTKYKDYYNDGVEQEEEN